MQKKLFLCVFICIIGFCYAQKAAPVLARYLVQNKKCIACRICVSRCPVKAIKMVNGKALIDQKKCTQCGTCFSVCPTKAILKLSEKSFADSLQADSLRARAKK